MDLRNGFLSASIIYSQLALKKSKLANIDKKDIQKSTFERNDEVVLGSEKNYNDNVNFKSKRR